MNVIGRFNDFYLSRQWHDREKMVTELERHYLSTLPLYQR